MNRKQALTLKAGDHIKPDPFWNEHDRNRKLSNPTIVLGTREAACESGVLVSVKFQNGTTAELSAGWFDLM